MKNIALALGLKEEASEQEILDTIAALPKGKATKGHAAAAIRAKVAVGLTHEQAVEALDSQAANDAAVAKEAKSKK